MSSNQDCIVDYGASLEGDVLQFQRNAFPHRRADWVEPRWRWMYLAAARRLGVAPMIWLYRRDGAIVGHVGAIPVRLKVGDREHLAPWLVEVMVDEAMRGRGIAPRLIAQAHQQHPLVLSVGQGERMRAIQLRTGWQKVGQMRTFVFVLDAERVLSGKLGNATIRKLAATALAALQRWKWRWAQRGSHTETQRLELVEIERFDSRHDRLWRAIQGEYLCAAVRDASYLNWKYVDQPGQRYLRLELSDGERAVALAVVQLLEPNSTYAYRRGVLVDVLVRPSDTGVIRVLFECVRQVCRRHAVDLIVFQVINDALARRADELGFVRRRAGRILLVLTDDPAHHLVRDGRNWLLTLGDSDIDRPW